MATRTWTRKRPDVWDAYGWEFTRVSRRKARNSIEFSLYGPTSKEETPHVWLWRGKTGFLGYLRARPVKEEVLDECYSTSGPRLTLPPDHELIKMAEHVMETGDSPEPFLDRLRELFPVFDKIVEELLWH